MAIVVVAAAVVVVAPGSCDGTGVFAATVCGQIGVLVAFVASEGSGGAFGGGAASAESMVVFVIVLYLG